MSAVAAWTSLLQEREIRMTPQRRYILDLLYRHNVLHPTVEQLLSLASDEGKRLSQATLYRTLSVLEQAGLVKKQLLHSGSAHYELASALTGKAKPHYHLVCLHCGRIAEARFQLPTPDLAELLQKRGFHAVGHELTVYGYCPDCQQH